MECRVEKRNQSDTDVSICLFRRSGQHQSELQIFCSGDSKGLSRAKPLVDDDFVNIS